MGLTFRAALSGLKCFYCLTQAFVARLRSQLRPGLLYRGSPSGLKKKDAFQGSLSTSEQRRPGLSYRGSPSGLMKFPFFYVRWQNIFNLIRPEGLALYDSPGRSGERSEQRRPGCNEQNTRALKGRLYAVWLIFVFALLFTLGCRTPPLEVDLVYVGPRSLASYWVCTPDPKLCDPPLGQKLVLIWHLNGAQFNALTQPKLHLRVRLSDYEEKSLWWDITAPSGKVVYSNVGTNECPPSNIGTYRVEILSEGKVAYCVEQALWTEWIQLQAGEPEPPGNALTPLQSFDTNCEKNNTSAEQDQQPYVWDDLEEIK